MQVWLYIHKNTNVIELTFSVFLCEQQRSYIVFILTSVITSKIELDDIVDKGFETLINDIKQAKILVKP